jgi:hypothetical protein
LAEEGTGKRQHDERDGRGAHQEQPPVANSAPAHRLVGNAPDEHQRRKRDDRLPLALNQVDENRDGDRRQAREEQGRQK